jgi:hypothetical protein
MTSLGLDYNNSIQLPLTLDGLNTVSTNSLNLDVGAGILQCDSLGDVFGSNDIASTANFLNEPSIQGITMTNFVRNTITGSTFVDYDKNTGVISLPGGIASKWNLDITGNVVYNINSTGSVATSKLIVTGNATMNSNLYVNNGIGVGQAPIGGAHRLNTKGRIRASAYDATDSSGVIETVSNGGYINYLYTAETGKSYYEGTTSDLNIQIPLKANSGLEVNTSSVHNAGIYVVGGSEMNGSLKIQSGLNVTGSSSFNAGLLITGGTLESYGGLYVTGGTSRFGRGLSISGNVSISGGVDIANQRLTIGNTGTYISVGDIRLNRNGTATEGRKIVFNYAGANATAQTQGLEWIDQTTTPQGQLGVYGGQNTLRFYAGGSEKLAIGANVDFATAPYVGGSQIDTNDVVEGTNLYYTDTRFDTRFATKTTTNLTEGTNLYYTDLRSRQAISAVSPLLYDNSTGIMSLPGSAVSKWGSGLNNTIYNLNTTGSVSMSALIVSGNATFNNVISVSGNVLVGIAPVESNVLISARKSGGAKIKVSSSSGADAELWMANTVGSYSLYSHNSVNSCRLYNYGTGRDLLTVLSNGNVGIGNTNPQFLLSLSANTDTTCHIKSNSTSGFAELFLQADNISAGGGIYINGSAGIAEGGANTLVMKNEIGGIIIRNNSLTGGIGITGIVGNVGINNVNATYTLDVIDNRPPLSVETTTQYSNDNIVVDSSGFGIFPREFVSANIGSNVDGLSFSGTFPSVNFSSANEDGSFYFTGTASGYVGINGGVGVAVWDTTSNLQFDFSIYVKQINGSANNWIVRCGTAGTAQGIFLNNSRRLQITNGTATAGSATTLALNTWYRVTAYCDTNPANNQITLIINGAIETLVLAGNSTVWTLHQLGINTTPGFIFYLNNYRLIKGVTSAVQDANPLSLRSSPVTNYALVRAAKTLADASLSRGGNILTTLGNFNGSQLKMWRLFEIVGPSPATAAYAINSGRFSKTSLNEKLFVHYRFSSYSNTTGSIWTTYFYIHRVDGSYTGFFDFSTNQWYGAANTQRLFSSGCFVLPDALPAGNYYIRFANASQLTMDTNDVLRMYLHQGISGA